MGDFLFSFLLLRRRCLILIIATVSVQVLCISWYTLRLSTVGLHSADTHSRTRYSLTFEANKSFPYFNKPISTHPNGKFRERYTIGDSVEIKLDISDVSKSKLILFYNPPGWMPKNLPSVCGTGVSACPIKSCRCSSDPKDHFHADAVIFDGVELKLPKPPTKYDHQVWIFYGIETPLMYVSTHFRSQEWRHMFNWTMTYRLDSDVVLPYDVLVRHQNKSNKNFTAIALNKTKSALWFVSHCETPSEREHYVNELREYYNVDIYGYCSAEKKRIYFDDEYEKYRFYLAFENSLCDDYVTEKLFKIYNRKITIVPIVRGRVKYASLLPKGTFINTADFSSPGLLAEYLKYLERNITAYVEMLRQKDLYTNVGGQAVNLPSAFCDICMKVHNLDIFSNHYHDVARWLKEDVCHRPNDFRKRKFRYK